MHVVIVNNTKIPVFHYGGTERVIWAEGKELVRMGHKVTFLVKKGSFCPFAAVKFLNEKEDLNKQIPEDCDVVHLHFPLYQSLNKPYVVTIHGNGKKGEIFDINSVFLSEDHAKRHNSKIYVFNGLDFEQYGSIDWNLQRSHVLFLAKAKRKEKNLKGAIRICNKANERLVVVGGYGFDITGKVVYKGFLGGDKKNKELNSSKCLLSPVLWNEPFGLSVIESLYFGSPVIATPFGSLPQIVIKEVGFLSDSFSELAYAVKNCESYNRKFCHEYCCDLFSSRKMTEKYLELFSKVLNGEKLNTENPRTLDNYLEQKFVIRE